MMTDPDLRHDDTPLAVKKRCGVSCVLFLLTILALVLAVVLYYEPTPTAAGMCKVYD